MLFPFDTCRFRFLYFSLILFSSSSSSFFFFGKKHLLPKSTSGLFSFFRLFFFPTQTLISTAVIDHLDFLQTNRDFRYFSSLNVVVFVNVVVCLLQSFFFFLPHDMVGDQNQNR